ncbi:hypothetical protein PR048_019043 [Dryococelus australis]|uniref:C2H2-type domain-containing protein n=1 Tax=Dryococelus australis TaxID=614101 RepID=A0ABQ9H2G4_9NEOP|nr:hypothetical protein PR048_019043 [Dryococelus australis]
MGDYPVTSFLRMHKQNKESGYQDWTSIFMCSVCGKQFLKRQYLSKHMAVHKGQTECPICHKILSRVDHDFTGDRLRLYVLHMYGFDDGDIHYGCQLTEIVVFRLAQDTTGCVRAWSMAG